MDQGPQYGEATEKALNYSAQPKRATSSKSQKVYVYPNNGGTFYPNQTIIVDLPSNQANTFLDPKTLYLQFNIKNLNNASSCNFENFGAYSLIKKIELLCGGNTVSTIDNFAVLASAMMDSDACAIFLKNKGNILFGADDDVVGADITTTGTDIVLPLVLTPLANAMKYIPLFSRDQFRLRITLNTAVQGTIGDVTADSDLQLSNVVLNYYQLVLSDQVMGMVAEACGNRYQLFVNDYRNLQDTLPANTNTKVTTLGFAFSSLNRVITIFRPSASTTSEAKPSNSNRSTAGITKFNLNVGGVKYPQREIQNGEKYQQSLAEMLISKKGLYDFSSESSINRDGSSYYVGNGTGITAKANIGSYFNAIDLESQMGAVNVEGGIISGISTTGIISQMEMTFSGNNYDVNIDYFAEYSLLLSLDMNGSQTWVASN